MVLVVEARSDVVGSLLRPQRLLAARQRFAEGRLTTAELKAVEDDAVEEALRLQEDAGVAVATDGEMRRVSFQSQVPAAVEGFSDWGLDAFLWGDWQGDEAVGDLRVERPELAVTGKLRRRRSLCADELEALGATYLQLDAPHYTMVLDPRYRDFYASRGWPTQRWIELGLELDNRVIGDRPGVTFGFHLCRGNQASRWLVEGGYEAVAEQIFGGIHARRLLLEYDDPRSGGFEPLARVPADRWVVLGLVTTKRSRLESVDDLARRIEAASRYVPLERLAVSPQCGFATSVLGNALTIDDERAKLGLVAEVARKVWG